MKNTGYAFAGVEKILQETLFPRLFFGKTESLSPIVGTLSTMLIKVVRLGLLNQVTSAKEKPLISQWVSAELIRAVTRGRGSPMPTTYGRSRKKDVKDIKTGKPQTKTNSRV